MTDPIELGVVEDDEVRETLRRLAASYDPDLYDDLPPSFGETQLANQAVERWSA